MGVYQSLYMGPYIIVPNKKTMMDETKRICSITASHSILPDALFCPKCGAKVIEVIKKKEKSISAWWALDELFSDRLAPIYDECLIPNQGLQGGSTVGHLKSDLPNIYSLPSNEEKENNMRIMKEQYAKEIQYLLDNGFQVSFAYDLIIDFS